MAYSLMAETKQGFDWPVLHAALAPIKKRVELFPISGAGGVPLGLGMSVPQRNCHELAWEELTQIIDVLQKKFSMEVYAMNTGKPITAETLEAVKTDFIKEC